MNINTSDNIKIYCDDLEITDCAKLMSFPLAYVKNQSWLRINIKKKSWDFRL